MESIEPTRDTIAAIASAINLGHGGVAIIRISGKDALNSSKNIVQTKSKYAWQSHRIFHGYIKDDSENTLIDEILIIVMKSPNSFTGEDIVELHCHGGVIVVNRVLKLLLQQKNVRLANPGEFSQRAFLNGKIDLSQAESINQLISSKNIRAAELAFNGVKGEISKKISSIKSKLIEQLSEIEARVDFDEEFTDFNYSDFENNINKIKNELINLIENSKRNAYLHNGLSIAIIGKTNAGKSSLLNSLSKQNKAIVTDIPGTTRDIIEVNLTLRNIPISIIDTAGIRNSNDLIENIGIHKSLEMISKADFIIYLYDLKAGFDIADKEIIDKIPDNKLISIIGNKIDLLNEKQIRELNLPKEYLLVSIKNNIGEEELLNRIIKKCSSVGSDNIDILLNERQLNNLNESLISLNYIDNIISQKLPFDLISIDLRDAITNLSKLTGEELTEELLDNIFSKFCIGK
ncbi:MAG: tRNA uridine-5-carboxymethylaminomethyl(34) synthesis GTPase MnmE [Prochlorococcus sp. SP3034]|nr:tRNA uridine-5-carboxymethylaminomethyl(34) synthesis GTPase MnmE [Prochlorococcus sp. SP3034]|tara:strand:- start:5936 stop:7318 length:1383 start_codon:yes stop_codon:yes gene_type:complete